jgi:hypothetical protein
MVAFKYAFIFPNSVCSVFCLLSISQLIDALELEETSRYFQISNKRWQGTYILSLIAVDLMKKIEKEICSGISHEEQCAAVCISLGCPGYSVQGVKMKIQLRSRG